MYPTGRTNEPLLLLNSSPFEARILAPISTHAQHTTVVEEAHWERVVEVVIHHVGVPHWVTVPSTELLVSKAPDTVNTGLEGIVSWKRSRSIRNGCKELNYSCKITYSLEVIEAIDFVDDTNRNSSLSGPSVDRENVGVQGSFDSCATAVLIFPSARKSITAKIKTSLIVIHVPPIFPSNFLLRTLQRSSIGKWSPSKFE